MCISIQQDALTAELYVSVRDAVGFYHYDREDARMALVDGRVAGIGRVVGDGRIAFFIKDLVVLPQYQGDGVGTAVLRALITRIREHCCNHAYIGLMATPGKESFYEEHGFLRRPAPGYGSGLVQFVDPVPLSAAESTATSGIK